MRALIIGDQARIVGQIQTVLARCGCECTDADLTKLDAGAENAGRARYDLAILVMNSDPAGSLSVLREVRNVTQANILTIGPASDAKLVLRTLREGADEYVADEDVETELEGAVLQLKTRHARDSAHGTVVSVLAPSGGSGASTLAANLAVALAAKQRQVAIAEVPRVHGDQQLLFDLQPAHCLAELCRHLRRLDGSMFLQSLAVHSSGVRLLAATSETCTDVTPEGVRQTLALSRTSFPYVVVDVDRTLARQQVTALLQSDLILIVLRLDLLSLNSTRRTLSQLQHLGISDSAVRVVVNRYRQPGELSYRKVEQALGLKLMHYIPNDPASVNVSIGKGVPTVIDSPRSKYARSLVQLASLIDTTCSAGAGRETGISTPRGQTTGVGRHRDLGSSLPTIGAAAGFSMSAGELN